MVPEDLTEPELRLWEAFATGDEVDLRPRNAADGGSVADGGDWGPERTVRASVIRALVLGGAESIQGETATLHLTGARISGRLRLVFAEACCVLWLEECWFEEAPQLYGAKLHVTSFSDSYLPGLGAHTSTVDGHFDLMNSHVQGKVGLHDARIGGGLLLQGAHLSNPGGLAMDGARLEVAGGIVGTRGFRADGELRLHGARLGEGLHLEGATLHHPEGEALSAVGIQVASGIDCSSGFRAEGAVTLTGAVVGGRVSFEGATLVRPQGHALACHHLKAGELVMQPARADGGIDLRHAAIGVLRLDHSHRPRPPLQLDGLVYQSLEPPLPVRERLAPGVRPSRWPARHRPRAHRRGDR